MVSRNPLCDGGSGRQQDQVVVVGVHQPAHSTKGAEATFVGAHRPVQHCLAVHVGDLCGKTDADIHTRTSVAVRHRNSARDRN